MIRGALAGAAWMAFVGPAAAQNVAISEPTAASAPATPAAAPTQPSITTPGGPAGGIGNAGLGDEQPAVPPDVSLTAPISPTRLPTTLDDDFDAATAPPATPARLPTPVDDDAIDERIDKGLTDAGEQSVYLPDYAFGAFQRGYFLTAFSLALDRAKAGDPKAQTLLGVLLSRGLGVKEDPAAAADWFTLAGGHGDPEAIYALGRMYLDAQGVKEDLAKAADLFEEAAKKGHAVAARELAYMLLQGRGRPKHATLAAAYLRRAADLGDMDAQFALAGLYGEGVGVVADDAQAARWFGAAAKNGHVTAEVEYGIMLFNGRGVAKNEAQAARWFAEAARADNPAAQIRIARLFAEGRGVDKNADEAARWYQIAKAHGEQDNFLAEWFGRLDEASRKRAFDAADRWLGPERQPVQNAAAGPAGKAEVPSPKEPAVDKAVQ